VRNGNQLVALNADGSVRWQNDSLNTYYSVNAGGAPALAGGGVLYLACQFDLCAVHTGDGSLRWRHALPVAGIAGSILIASDSSIMFTTLTEIGTGYRPSYLVKLRGRFPLADAPWPVDGGDLRRTRRGRMP